MTTGDDKIKILVDGEPVGVLSEFRPSPKDRAPVRTLTTGSVPSGNLVEPGPKVINGGVEIISCSLVAAPPCKDCNQPMKGEKPCHWACETDGCPEKGTRIDALYNRLPTPIFAIE